MSDAELSYPCGEDMFRRARQTSSLEPDMEAARQAFLDKLADGQPTPRTEEEAAAAIHAGLQEVYRRLQKTMAVNYDTARELHHVRVGGRVAARYIRDALPLIETRLAEQGIDLVREPVASAMLDRMRDYFEESSSDQKPLDLFRRDLAQVVRQAKTPADVQSATLARQLFDDTVRHCIEDGTVTAGAPREGRNWLEAMTAARRARRRLYEAFEPHGEQDAAGRIIEELATRRSSPRQALKALMGAGPYGSHGPSPYLARRLAVAFEDSPSGWHCVRSLAWLRLTREGLSEEGITSAVHQNPALTEALFAEEELALMPLSGVFEK
ncbi:hypothetical protein [Tepidicaulis sp.]|uniref:hypothetical protein n=1 Tax=Tepidicaulis sp. TaxID=1920809 RepID=UPI003B5BC7A9